MGRSVSTHRHAVATIYIHLDEDFDPDFGWSDFIEDIRNNVLKEKFPSLTDCDRWQGRENHVILENRQVEISVSEYCGVIAVCMAPVDANDGLYCAVAERMAKSFHDTVTKAFKSNALVKLGSFSNGEGVFQKIS